jgi:transcriptional regulator with XRE-family HTH domain
MDNDLRKRFGNLLAAHRHRLGMTQQSLAEATGISSDMIAKMERGTTGARFPTIEKLCSALHVDPAELFTSDLPRGALTRAKLTNLTARLSKLSDAELDWVDGIIAAVLRPKP